MALSFLLETKGYETSLVLIHDENLTEYGEDGLYHTFCVVKNQNLAYNGTLITLKEYPNYGNSWIILDPAFNQIFGEDPKWLVNYKTDDGISSLPSEVYNSLRITQEDVVGRLSEMGLLA